jgi:hypothetical protein
MWSLQKFPHVYQLKGSHQFPSLDGKGKGRVRGGVCDVTPTYLTPGPSPLRGDPTPPSPVKGEEGGGREMVLS